MYIDSILIDLKQTSDGLKKAEKELKDARLGKGKYSYEAQRQRAAKIIESDTSGFYKNWGTREL